MRSCAREDSGWRLAPGAGPRDDDLTHTYVCVLFHLVMDTRDSIGRKRLPTQNRGLRPLFPKLPTSFESRAVRIAMTTPAWRLIDALVAERAQETRPRALGEVIETLLAHFETSLSEPRAATAHPREPESLNPDWQAWQIQKERALLPAAQLH